MATPRGNTYTVASGGSVYAGIARPPMDAAAGGFTLSASASLLPGSSVSGPTDLIRPPAAGVSNVTALIGDSLTEHFFQATPFYWQNGLLGAPLDIIANSGVSGRSVGDLENEIANSYQDAGGHPGLAGLPALGWVFVRIGTNGWRGTSPVASVDAGTQADFLSIISQLKAYAEHIVVHPIPPIVGGVSSPTYARDVYNAWIMSVVAADTSGRVHWIDDTTDVTDGTGGGIAGYFEADGYHMNRAGSLRMAQTAGPLLTALFANQGYARAPLVTDAADVYPAQPQWTVNPTNAGSGTPAGVSVGQYGVGFTSSSSIVAADGGDSNTVPWLRITPTALGLDGYALAVTMAGAGRAVTASDPSQLEHIVELRFNGLQGFRLLESWSQKTSGEKLTQKAYLQMDSAGVTETAVLRLNLYRFGNTPGGPIEHAIYLWSAGAMSGSLGSFDVRCWSLRG